MRLKNDISVQGIIIIILIDNYLSVISNIMTAWINFIVL